MVTYSSRAGIRSTQSCFLYKDLLLLSSIRVIHLHVGKDNPVRAVTSTAVCMAIALAHTLLDGRPDRLNGEAPLSDVTSKFR